MVLKKSWPCKDTRGGTLDLETRFDYKSARPSGPWT